MRRAEVEKARTWDEFKAALPGQPGKKWFTAVTNRRLDAIVRNMDLPLEDRFDALLLRTSWGNFSDFACDRVTKSQQPAEPEEPIENVLLKPIGQVDFARILKVRDRTTGEVGPASKQRISQIVQLRQDQGLMARPEDLVNPGRLVPLYEPAASLKPGEMPIAWQTFSAAWDSGHVDLFEALQKAEAEAAPFVAAAAPYVEKVEEIRAEIHSQKMADFKAAQKVPRSPDAAKSAEPETPAGASPGSDGQKVRGVVDKKSGESETVSAPRSHGPGIDTRAGALNLKQGNHETTTTAADQSHPEDSVVVVSRKLGITKKAARIFLEECRSVIADSTVEEILGTWGHQATTIGPSVKNPTGVLLLAVPARIAAYREYLASLPPERPQGPGPWQPTVENLRAVLERWARQVEALPSFLAEGSDYAAIAAGLRTLLDDDSALEDIEALETRLAKLDAALIVAAESSLSTEERKAVGQLPPEKAKALRGKMTAEQGRHLLRQHFERELIELRRLPRLSLFYATHHDAAEVQGVGA
jgi:hypothetical protein